MTLTIRPAQPDDYEVLCALFDEADEFHRRWGPEFCRPFDGPLRTRRG